MDNTSKKVRENGISGMDPSSVASSISDITSRDIVVMAVGAFLAYMLFGI